MSLHRVIPGLYISDIRGSQDLHGLQSNGITHIVQAMGGLTPPYRKYFQYKVLDVADVSSENLMAYFEETGRWIKQAIQGGGSVLVHW